jgi:hypothetical protein
MRSSSLSGELVSRASTAHPAIEMAMTHAIENFASVRIMWPLLPVDVSNHIDGPGASVAKRLKIFQQRSATLCLCSNILERFSAPFARHHPCGVTS